MSYYKTGQSDVCGGRRRRAGAWRAPTSARHVWRLQGGGAVIAGQDGQLQGGEGEERGKEGEAGISARHRWMERTPAAAAVGGGRPPLAGLLPKSQPIGKS